MLKFSFKPILNPNSSAKTHFQSEVNPNSTVLNQACAVHLDGQFF